MEVSSARQGIGVLVSEMRLNAPSLRLAAAVAAGSAAVVLVLYGTARHELGTLTEEDGVVEWLTAIGYFVAAGAFALAARSSSRGRWWMILLAVGFFWVAGEEISWGQRLLGLSTPSTLNHENVQHELTLHNIKGVQGNVRLVGFAIFSMLYVVLPFVAADARVAPWLRRYSFPVPPAWVAPPALAGLAFMVVPRVLGNVIFSLDEIGELYLGAVAGAYGLAIRSRRRRDPQTPG